MAYIEGIFIGALDARQMVTAPPDRMLEIIVIGGIATLRIRAGDHLMPEVWIQSESDEDLHANPPSIEVPARALLIALRAAVEEDELPQPEGERTQRDVPR